jgi:EmrB/QacA subfamily drug resistance transporter
VAATPPTSAAQSAADLDHQRTQLVGFALGSVLAALMVTLLLSALDQTIVGTALPTIIGELNGVNEYTWVVTAYLVTSTTVIPIVSKLSDQFGRKWLLIGAVLVFLVGSAASGASQTMEQLIAFRALQGIGGGALATLVFTLVGDIFTPADRARWQGLFSGVFGLASVIGPALGGWITDNSTWRWIFYVNLPLGVIALALVFFFLPSNISVRSSATGRNVWARIDWWGAITSASATVLLLLGLTWGGATYPWNSWQVIAALVGAGVLFIAFAIAELTAREPILPLDLFKNQIFTSGALLAMIVGLALFSVVIYLPVFLQGVLGVKATNSGLIVTPLVVSLAIAAALVGFLVARVGRYQFISIIGALVIVGGFYLLSTMDVNTDQQTVVYYMIVLGVGLGMLQPVMTLAVQNAIPLNRLGAGTGAVTYLRTLGSALGAALIGAIVTNASEVDLNPRLATVANSDKFMTSLRSATNTLTNSQALQPLLTIEHLRNEVLTKAVQGANSGPQAQQAIDQAIQQAQNSPQTLTAIQQAQNSPQTLTAIQQAQNSPQTLAIIKQQVAQLAAKIPASDPHRKQKLAEITKQVTQQIDQGIVQQIDQSIAQKIKDAIASQIPAAVHKAITTQVTDTFAAILDAGKHALAAGIHQGYLVSVGIGVLLVIVTLFLKDVPLRGGARASMAEGAEAVMVSEAAGEVPATALIAPAGDERVPALPNTLSVSTAPGGANSANGVGALGASGALSANSPPFALGGDELEGASPALGG